MLKVWLLLCVIYDAQGGTLFDLEISGSKRDSLANLIKSNGYLVIDDALSGDMVFELASRLVSCSNPDGIDGPGILRSTNIDGSLRATIASFSNGDEVTHCGEETRELINEYKRKTQEVGIIVARFLDTVIASELAGVSSDVDFSLEDVVNDPESKSSLDHFHIYSSPISDEKANMETSVPFHVDMGLFLLLTPAVYIGESDVRSVATGLLVRKSDGSIIEVQVKEPNSLIIVIGDAIVNWMYPDMLPGFHPGVHAVKGGAFADSQTSRVVLARMFLPRPDTKVSGVRFEDFFLGRPNSSKLRRLNEEQCAAGDKYCWMQCMADINCGSGVESVCVSEESNKICTDEHDCDLKCPETPAPLLQSTAAPSTQLGASAPFCRGSTSMVMSGFESVGSENAHCIILFFKPWLLDSGWKFAIACIGLVLMGILVELLIKARRVLTNSKNWKSKHLKDALIITLFAINISFGYLCMLAAMTFNVEIFIATVLGLTIGHLVVGNIHQPVRESADACCVTSEPTVEVKTSLRNSTGACCCNEN